MAQHSFVLSRRVRRAPEVAERALLALPPGDYAGLIVLTAWARDAAEIRVRPLSRRPERWSGRRQLRYFDRAHEAIDALARILEHQTPAPVERSARRTA